MTASKVAAVLGLSPWQSPRSLYHQMRGELPRDEGKAGTVNVHAGHDTPYLTEGMKP